MRETSGRIDGDDASARAAGPADPEQEATAPMLAGAMMAELVELHARALRRIPVVQFLVVAGIGTLVLKFVPLRLFLGWAALSMLVEAMRGATAYRVLRAPERVDAAVLHRLFVVLAALAGGAVGLGAWAFLPRLPVERQAVLGIVLFGMPSAGVAVAVASREILLAYAVCILVPAACTWTFLHPSEAGVLPLTAVYLGFLAVITSDGQRLLMRSVAIRMQRDGMIKALESSNAEVREAMQRAQDAAQARARVLAAASHDLRQPLHALSVYVALLRTHPDSRTMDDVGNNVEQIVRSLGQLLNGLLDLSRVSSGAQQSPLEVVNLDELVAQICREFDAAARAKGLALVRDCSPLRARTDPLAVARILRNLLDNAVKYTDSGEIRVIVRGVSGEGRHASISVVDSGRGIDPMHLPHIFEEFYQADNPGRDRSRGVGLGLAIVQRLAEGMGASVEVESTPGRGSLFRVVLPVAVASERVSDEAHEPACAAPGDGPVLARGLRVYVVDDEAAILDGLSALLRAWGAAPQTAIDGRRLEALFERHGPPDLLIIDLRLGGPEHGGALATRMRALHGDFAVLVLTGESAGVAQKQAGEAGFLVLQKPVADRRLRQAIADALARDRTRTTPG